MFLPCGNPEAADGCRQAQAENDSGGHQGKNSGVGGFDETMENDFCKASKPFWSTIRILGRGSGAQPTLSIAGMVCYLDLGFCGSMENFEDLLNLTSRVDVFGLGSPVSGDEVNQVV